MTEGINDAAVAALKKRAKLSKHHEENPRKTHFPGCWETHGHHQCALLFIQDLSDAMDSLEEQIKKRREWHRKENVDACPK